MWRLNFHTQLPTSVGFSFLFWGAIQLFYLENPVHLIDAGPDPSVKRCVPACVHLNMKNTVNQIRNELNVQDGVASISHNIRIVKREEIPTNHDIQINKTRSFLDGGSVVRNLYTTATQSANSTYIDMLPSFSNGRFANRKLDNEQVWWEQTYRASIKQTLFKIHQLIGQRNIHLLVFKIHQ